MITYTVITLMFLANVHCQQTFKAAIVQLEPERNSSLLPGQIVPRNAELFITHIKRAKDAGAKIVVFPENGLTTLEPLKTQLTHLALYSLTFKEGDTPCMNTNSSKALMTLSCAAKSNQLSVVINVLEKIEGADEYYNTNVVFDEEGKIIKIYRKINLQNEENYKSGHSEATFTIKVENTDVTFGLLIGEDILHETAYKVARQVQNVVYSSSMPSKLPYFNGLSLQVGYAIGNNVNLLASSYYSLKEGISGSGIYHYNGNIPKLVSFNNSALIVADVPVFTKPNENTKQSYKLSIKDKIGTQSDVPLFKYKVANMNGFQNLPITTKDAKKEDLCNKNKDICCEFQTSFENDPVNTYEFSYFEGDSKDLDIKGNSEKVFICQITSCLKNKTCTNTLPATKLKSLSAKVTASGNVHVLPITLRNDFLPFNQANVEKEKRDVTVSLDNPDDIGAVVDFGFYIIKTSGAFGLAFNSVLLVIGSVVVYWL